MGGHATKDLDVWVEASAENAPKVIEGLIEFGPPLMGLTEADLKTCASAEACLNLKIIWPPEAADDFESAVTYLVGVNPAAARRLVASVLGLIE